MKTDFLLKTLWGCMVLTAILPVRSAAQAAAPAVQSAQPASICSGRAGCYEAGDFVAIMTDFRVSTTNGWKVIDTTLHFQNKTNQPLILGYTEGSAMAIDDQGNRYGLSGQANAVRGIGRIGGNSIDPKFSLPPGGAGDTMFELAWYPGSATQGVNFELDLSVREVSALEGHQFSLAGESPLQFRGLSNGMFGSSATGSAANPAGAGLMPASGSPVLAAATPVCGSGSTGTGNTASTLAAKMNSVAGLNVPPGGNSAITNASASLSNLKSMFGRKKAAAAATPAASSDTSCVAAPTATAASMAVAPSSMPPAGAATSTVAATATQTIPATAKTAASAATPAVATTQTTPAAAKTVAHTATVTTLTTTKTTLATTKPAAKKPTPPPTPSK